MILEMLGAMLPWHHLLKNKTPESKQKIFKMKLSLHTNLHKYFWIDSNRNIPCLKRATIQTSKVLYQFACLISRYGFYDKPNYDQLRTLLVKAESAEKQREEKKRKTQNLPTVSDDEICIQFPSDEQDCLTLIIADRCERWRKRAIRVLQSPISLSRRDHAKKLYDQAEVEFDSFFGCVDLQGLQHRALCVYVDLMEKCSWAT